MPQDPVSGKQLPDGFVLLRIDGRDVVQAKDYRGRNLPGPISDRIVRGWRNPDSAPRSARLAYTAWQVSRRKGPGAGIADWQINMARGIIDLPPEDWGNETEDAVAGMLTPREIRGGSGVVAVRPHPGQTIEHATPAGGYITPIEVYGEAVIRPGRHEGALWLYTRNLDAERRARVYSSTRIVSYLSDWAPWTTDVEAIIWLHERLRVFPPAHRPAQLAWRVFRQFITAPPARLSLEAMALCARSLDTYAIKVPQIKRLPYAWVYDKNCAYGDYLRRIPDLSKGRFIPVTAYHGPLAIYDTEDGVRSGFWITSSQRESTVQRGWAWDGDYFAPSPFERFVDFCYEWSGPLQPLVKRFPAFIVGKSNAHDYDRHTATVIARATFYPIIWTNVLGGLEAEMRRIIRQERAHHAFVDAVHMSHEAADLPIGVAVGEWRLVASGPATYAGLNRFRVGDLVRHQGIPSPRR